MDNRVEVYQRAVEILENNGYDSEFRDSYSGRAMFGRSVPAIVSSGSGVAVGLAIAEATLEIEGDPEGDMGFCDVWKYEPRRSDSMGLSSVFY